MTSLPKFLLFTDPSNFGTQTQTTASAWKFRLIDQSGQTLLAVRDEEPGSLERLALLAVVRGLESLDGPADVTLVNPHRYVSRGLDYGLESWRAQHWRWERFGQLVEIRNADLWQRVDRAMRIHRLSWRNVRIDTARGRVKKPNFLRRRAKSPEAQAEYQVA